MRGELAFYELPEEESDIDAIQDPSQYKYQNKVAYYRNKPESYWTNPYWMKRRPRPENFEDIKNKMSWPISKRLKVGKIIIIKAGDRYVALKPVKFVRRYSSIEEVPEELKNGVFFKKISEGGYYKKESWVKVRPSRICDLPEHSRKYYEEIKDENGKTRLRAKFEYLANCRKSMIYDWKSWEEKPLPNVGVTKTSMARSQKSFYLAGINLSWDVAEQSQQDLSLNYKVRLSSIQELEFALVDGLKIAEIQNPNLYEFKEVAQSHGSGIHGKISVGLNQVVVFRINNDKCFALMPARTPLCQ